jgi:electron transport complex protein RnfE
MASDEKGRAYDELVKGIWRENPVFVALLGLCPALAVTNSFMNGLVMGLATCFVLICSSAMVSALRKLIPKAVRISTYIIIIATFVTVVDFVLAALLPDAHKQLGAFLSLIVVNCLILGRQEAFASKNRVGLAVADAAGMALGFTLTLVMIGGIREVLGEGKLAGISLFGDRFEPWVVMKLPPGGFLTLGMLLVTFAWVRQRRTRREEASHG